MSTVKKLSTLQAQLDVAQTTEDNQRHWQYADGQSADAAYSPHVRDVLRRRARYEFVNNSICKGIVRTFVNDVVGRGPMLQLHTGRVEQDQQVERAWRMWGRAVSLPQKLRLQILSRIVSGESLAVLAQNPRLGHPIKLDVECLECDRLQNPMRFMDGQDASQALDGIELDQWGNPSRYMILNQHPGALVGLDLSATAYPARNVLHDFTKIRPEQHRGIPDITQALPLFANLRRYTEAVIAAAETAADFSAVMESQNMPDEGPVSVEPMDLLQIEKRMMLTLPQGWKLNQLRSEQPTNVYAQFKREIVAETCRCLNIPYVAGAADASGHNFSSAKLDMTSYNLTLDVERQDLEVGLDRILYEFVQDLRQLPDFNNIPQVYEHEWLWANRPNSDPREAQATQTKIQSMQTTLAEVSAARGRDWMEVVDEVARIKSYVQEKGLTEKEVLEQVVEPEQEGHPELEEND